MLVGACNPPACPMHAFRPLSRTVIRGATWYQGESNTGVTTPGADVRQYSCGFAALIRDWRLKWHAGTLGHTDPDFPFGWVQLNSCYRSGWAESRTVPPRPVATNWSYSNPPVHPTPGDPLGAWRPCQPCACSNTTPPCPRGTPCRGQGDGFPSVRWAFEQTLGAVPNGFQAISLDTPSAYGSVHSPYKQPVGARLARAALAAAYGQSQHRGPTVGGASIDAADPATVLIQIDGVGPGGLELRARVGFELLGADGLWHSAPVIDVRDNHTVRVSVGGADVAPTAVRYLWYDTPCSNAPYSCPVYAVVPALGELSGELDHLPLGPFMRRI